MRLAAQLSHRSITLVMPPRFDGWLLQRPPPSVLNGNLPVPAIKLPSATNLPLRPSCRSEIFELHYDGDRE